MCVLLLVLAVLLAGSARAAPGEDFCAELNKTYQGGARTAVVSQQGRVQGVALLWGAAPARAGAALLAALLAVALHYRVHLAPAPHRLVELAASIEFNKEAIYSELKIVVSAAWAGERGAECNTTSEVECGLAGPRLRELGRSSIPAHARLHLRLAPAAPARCARAARWRFYTDNSSLAECHFIFDAGIRTPVYYPAEEASELRAVVAELQSRADAASLPLLLQPLNRSDLIQKLRSVNDSFLFLDYNIWKEEPHVLPVAPPPCANVSFACHEDLDPSLALRAVDSNILTLYSPQLFDTFHRFDPPLSSLRTILKHEADGHAVEQAACKWAIDNGHSFRTLINETVHRVAPVGYVLRVFLCGNDVDNYAYIALMNIIYKFINKLDKPLKNSVIAFNIIEVDCADPKYAIVEGDKVFDTTEGKSVIGLVAGGEGPDLAAFAARNNVPLVLFEPPADDIDAGAASLAQVWSSVGRLRHLALVLRHLAADMRWTRLAVVSDPTPLARDFFHALNNDTHDLVLREYAIGSKAEGSTEEAKNLLQTLRTDRARIVFVNARADIAATVLSAAAEARMVGDEYAWIVRDWPPAENTPRVRVISITPWCRGDNGTASGAGSPELRAAMNQLWPGRDWPARAVALADALLTLSYAFQETMRRHPFIIEYDIHTAQIMEEFGSVVANGLSGRAGVLEELSYEAATSARAQPLVFVDEWSGGARSPLGRCRVAGARVNCTLRPLFQGDPPADGASGCKAATGDAFAPYCHDPEWIGVLVLAALALPASYLARREVLRRLARRDRLILATLLARRQRAASTLATHLEPRSALELREELGTGRFGRVHLALLRSSGRTRVVAAKSLREGAAPSDESEFLREACTLAALEHEHVVRLVGVCADDGPPLVLMEHAFFGDLLRYLRARRHLAEAAPDGSEEAAHVAPEALTRLAREAASALGYLALRGLVHRDVRAANCLVDARRSLKLADFGMARETVAAGADGAPEYACRRRALFPVLWMAPESLARGVFSAASDVWALGVLLLELVTLGERPYGDMSPLRVLEFVAAGGRPPLPLDAAPQTRGVVLACWQRVAEQRPTAPELVSYLAAHPRALLPALRPPRAEPTDADSGFSEPSSPDLQQPDFCLKAVDSGGGGGGGVDAIAP